MHSRRKGFYLHLEVPQKFSSENVHEILDGLKIGKKKIHTHGGGGACSPSQIFEANISLPCKMSLRAIF